MSVRSSSILLLVLLLIIINLHELHAQQFQTSCPYIRTSVIVSDCVFDTGLYLSLGARIFNTRSIDFVGHYSLDSIPVLPVQNKLNTEPINTLVYNLSGTFVSIVPLILNCPRLPENIIFTECQYTTIKLKSSKMRQQSEYVRAQLSILNVTDLGIRSVLFLQPGEIALQSCKAYDCDNQRAYLTASNETFDMSIRYEKPVDSVCQLTEDCSSVIDLVHCSTLTHTCQCNNQNTSIVDFNHLGRYCVDSITQSNCTKFSRRCLKYCDSSQTPHCLCPPILTRKVRKTNGLYDCELERDSSCTVNDQIAKCPTGTYCDGVRCRTTVSFGSISQDNVTFYRRTSPPTLHEQNLLSSTADIKSHRFRIASASTYSENKSTIPTPTQSSSQYKNQRSLYKIPNTPPPSSSNNYPDSLSTVSTIVNGQSTPFCRYNLPTSFDNYMSTNTGGLLPQSQLSPRFHRQTTTTSQLRSLNVPPPIRTPSSTRIMMFPDHTNILSKHLPPTRIVTNNYHQTTTMRKNNSTMPIVTRLQNGDVLISA
ncbi:unnamed protein product [Didymodactylos carnosus]|uniref:Uncharacterized protein n=1 Tax=Didymodactylos carnosus TaxID=1234261 RepID=A0A814LCZ0_9BILA|nr:unnamed protein product [Didymodactylos carnosus]CAF1130984.1 unnamed protein product [Didymodactylos carnosus]CAF3831514.1 unnamed protein product [Didymodactylos carnosus]CAF3914055.1 unnamed protein product [Didymodactylos carnosus]